MGGGEQQHLLAIWRPDHLGDNALFDFRNLTLDTEVEEGDIAFDREDMPMSGTIPINLVG